MTTRTHADASTSARRLDAAVHALRASAELCRHVQRAILDHARPGRDLPNDPIAASKHDNSPVTVADFAVQALVVRTLQSRLGAIRIVGEESSDMLRSSKGAALLRRVVETLGRHWANVTEAEALVALDAGAHEPPSDGFWALDPIDGTKGFLRGQQYAIALAWIENGSPTLGVLACPNLPPAPSDPQDRIDPDGSLYAAWTGGGLWTGSLAAHRDPARSQDIAPIDEHAHALGLARTQRARSGQRAPIVLCTSVERAHSDLERTSDVLASLGRPVHDMRVDSQCKYGLVADGRADVYVRLPSTRGYVERIWDHAAGEVIAREAGAIVSDALGRPLDYSQGRGLERNVGVLCAAPDVHGPIVRAIQANASRA